MVMKGFESSLYALFPSSLLNFIFVICNILIALDHFGGPHRNEKKVGTWELLREVCKGCILRYHR
jgi:hypothetical protein